MTLETPAPARCADDFLFHDYAPTLEDFRAALLAGLAAPQKAIPCRFLYDATGSALFDLICTLPDYYPTRTEMRILEAEAAAIAAAIGPDAQLIELGSGSCAKVGLLLDALERPAAYIPIDISREHLLGAAQAIKARYAGLGVEAICADYGQEFALPSAGGRRVGLYFGSTIGNLTPEDARVFLARWAQRLGPGAMMLVGADLRKDAATLERAYDDAEGVTARFSLNVLARANREAGADFDLTRFRHRARYHAQTGQVEIHLVSLAAQSVRVGDRSFALAEGEAIHVEDSWKFRIADFQAQARASGFTPAQVWTDPNALFSLHLLEVAPL
jgi:dimethylhistidine N-methyltransferase